MRNWSEHEVMLLREHYPTARRERLERMLNRSWGSIRMKAKRLGVTRKNSWSEQELALLREYYHDTHKEELERMLNRSWNAIKVKANRFLGLKRLPEFAILPDKLEISEADRGYLAGIVDGEGTICFVSRKASKSRFSPRLQIPNTDRKIIEKCQRILGGNCYQYEEGAYHRLGKKTRHLLVIAQMGLLYRVLEAIKTELAAKKEHAELVMKFIEKRFEAYSRRNHPRDRVPYSDEELEIVRRVCKLNE